MEIKIYQINIDRDYNLVAFANLEALERYQGTSEIDSTIYDEVFSGTVDCSELEDVYRMFNLDHPEGYTGRSLSVSDVVQITAGRDPAPGFYFCDSFGFEKVRFEPERVPKSTDYGTRDADAPDEWHESVPQDRTIRVVLGSVMTSKAASFSQGSCCASGIQLVDAECFQRWNIVFYRVPYDLKADASVMVCDNVSHTLHLTPVKPVSGSSAKFGRQLPG